MSDSLDEMWSDMGLSKFSAVMAQRFVASALEDGGADFAAVGEWLRAELVHRRGGARAKPPSEWQAGCPEVLPSLTAKPLWSTDAVPGLDEWLRDVVAPALPDIQAEVLALRKPTGEGGEAEAVGFQEYKAPTWSGDGSAAARLGTDSGQWNVLYLHLHDVDTATAASACPVTMRVLGALPRAYNHSMFSAMAAGTHITPHHGPTNKKLRLQIPISVPPDQVAPGERGSAHDRQAVGCGLRVADEVVLHRQGEPILFDDSFQHEAWNWCASPRLVLIADIWHPQLSSKEVKFLTFLAKAQQRAARALSKRAGVEAGDDFYALLASGVAPSASAVFPVPEDAATPAEATEG